MVAEIGLARLSNNDNKDWEVGSDEHSDKYGFNKLNYMVLDPPTCPHWFFPVPKRRMDT